MNQSFDKIDKTIELSNKYMKKRFKNITLTIKINLKINEIIYDDIDKFIKVEKSNQIDL